MPARSLRRAVAVLAAALILALAVGPSVSAAGPRPSWSVRAACGVATPGNARCFALARVDTSRLTTAAPLSVPDPGSLTPADLLDAYGLTAAASTNGASATIAIIDAYDAPTAEADLATYRSQFGLAACRSITGCFSKVNQTGGTTYPAYNAGWASEIALDLDMASAICPNCKILLVEASSANVSDLGTAVNLAVTMGAKYISNSYGANENSSETTWDATWYTHPGVVVTASTGDSGYSVSFPAASPHVIAVGGTSLTKVAGLWTQSAWSGAGSGCSLYEPKPAWQADLGCAKRTLADVSAVADPFTGVAVYCSTGTGCSGWTQFGGTSASAPIVAAAYAISGVPAASTYPGSYPYLKGGLTDVVGGSNGSCPAAPYLCQAVAGYDGPTGLGTPNGTAPFMPVGAPGKPQGVSAIAGNGTATVSWSAPSSYGCSASSGYTAISSPGGKTCTTVAPTTTCTVSALANGQAYTFTVTATNGAGTGLPSTASAPVTPRTVPGIPTGVTAQAGNGSVGVTWTAPVSDGGAAITAYTVTSTPDGKTCSWTSGPLECTVGSLSNGQSYTFTVIATNVAGDGTASSPSVGVTPSSLPDPPTGVVATPNAPHFGELTVTWDAPANNGSPLTSYTATAYDGAAFHNGAFTSTGHACTVSGAPPVTTCTITGLTLGVPVVVRVTATSGAGTSLASVPSAQATPPTAPKAVVTALPTWALGTPIPVTWAGTPGTNAIATYDVRYRRVAWNSATWTLVSLPATSSSSLPLAVAPGYTYCVSVSAHDVDGFVGSWSAERCTATPLDDRSLARKGGWSTGTGSAYYRGTWIRSTTLGATAVRASVQAKRISIVVSTCPTCGSIKVYLGSTLLRSISLVSSTAVNRKVITVATFTTVRSGAVTVKVSTSGRKVLVDGLAISRT